MKLIESKTLATAAASIEFTSIPQTYTDLVILISVRAALDESDNVISFNGSTANFSGRRLIGDGSSASTGTVTRAWGFASFLSNTANTFGNGRIYIPNYAGATNKSFSSDSVNETNATSAYQTLFSNLWSNTAAITSLAISPNAGNYVAGSTISLYGVLKGSDGIVTTS
jgi:hypothetical protein